MSMITIKEKEYFYDETNVFNFAEGLIGMPGMRRAVLIPLDEYEPFCWLASLDDEKSRFIVVNPRKVFAGYEPNVPANMNQSNLETLAIVKICSDWTQTTVNLRAPIFIDVENKSGVQAILSDSSYKHAENLPQG